MLFSHAEGKCLRRVPARCPVWLNGLRGKWSVTRKDAARRFTVIALDENSLAPEQNVAFPRPGVRDEGPGRWRGLRITVASTRDDGGACNNVVVNAYVTLTVDRHDVTIIYKRIRLKRDAKDLVCDVTRARGPAVIWSPLRRKRYTRLVIVSIREDVMRSYAARSEAEENAEVGVEYVDSRANPKPPAPVL